MFSNEFHRETFVQRQPGESPNDHSDRAIRRAAEWYQAQLGEAVEVLLLTNDVDNKQKAIAAGLKAQSIHAYVRSLPEADELQVRVRVRVRVRLRVRVRVRVGYP